MTEDSQQAAVANLKSCVAAYPACVEKNVLWVWPWKEDPLSVAGNKMAHPEGFLGGVGDDPSTYTRDTPYGWDTLVENLIDPSHVPFAHHGMQGKRTDAIPINMTMLTPISEDDINSTMKIGPWGCFGAEQESFELRLLYLMTPNSKPNPNGPSA